MPVWLIQIIIGIILNVVAMVLLAAAQKPKPPELTEMENPTAEAGRPIPVIMGSGTVSSVNIIGDWDKEAIQRTIPSDASKK